ncbi:MAG: TVP38/TMEM64 family protein, partial [Micromonosporaceae bacterium]|nr:TVP38/TMEM64 family protein [Micromonosporaceae bacterium]
AATEQWITREGALAVAAVRSLPVAPYGLVGYAYGASGVRVRDYAVGTLLASSPSAVTYALLGAAVVAAEDATPLTLLPLVIGVVLSTAVAVRSRRHLRATGPGRRPVS